MKRQLRNTILLALSVFCFFSLSGRLAAENERLLTHAGRAPRVRLHTRQFVPAAGLDADLASGARHGLIQFAAMPDDAVRLALKAAGVELLAYVPELTWVAALPADLGPVQSVPGVRWIGALQAADKIDPALDLAGDGDWTRQPEGTVALWVSGFPDVDDAALEAAIDATLAPLGGRVAARGPEAGKLVVHAPAVAARDLAALDGVAWVALPPPAPIPLNDGVRQNTGADVAQASPYDLDGSGVRVAIWDAGEIDAHPDFDSRLIIARDTYIDNHATHIAGTVAGSGINSDQNGNEGAPLQYRGVAPGAEIISYHTYGSPTTDHDEAINTYGADVSQNAWGYGSCSLAGLYDYYARDYDDIARGSFGRGISIVFATGNWGSTCGSPYGAIMPGGASAKNTVTVGNIKSDADELSTKTAWGPTLDGRLKPEIVAPGSRGSGGIKSTIAGGGYGGYIGSSMSSAAVSGGIALVLQAYRDVCSASGDAAGNPTPATLKALLVHSARDLAGGGALTPGPDFASGYGRADFLAAVDLVPYHRVGAVSHGVIDSFTVVVAQQNQLKFTLAWDDPGAAAYAAQALVNDLDLQVIAPDGTTVYGPWQLDPTPGQEGNPALRPTWQQGDAPVRDGRNVVEQVMIDHPMPGTWTVQVVGSSVPVGPQSYALVSQDLASSSCASMIVADSWVMDTTGDTGEEPGEEPVGLSQDVWVQLTPLADGEAPAPETPEFGATNYVYAYVRNNGEQPVANVQALVYWAEEAAGMAWPADWHLLGRTTVVNLPAGESAIAGPFAWELPEAPSGTSAPYSLYARLITPQDPLCIVEGIDTGLNAQQSNNITRRDTPVISPSPTALTGLTVYAPAPAAPRFSPGVMVTWVAVLAAWTLATLASARRFWFVRIDP